MSTIWKHSTGSTTTDHLFLVWTEIRYLATLRTGQDNQIHTSDIKFMTTELPIPSSEILYMVDVPWYVSPWTTYPEWVVRGHILYPKRMDLPCICYFDPCFSWYGIIDSSVER